MELPFATASERRNYINILIEEERPHSLLRVMRKRPLILSKTRDATNLVHFSSLSTGYEVWSENDGFEKIKVLSPFSHLDVWIPEKEAARILKILMLVFWPPKFEVHYII